MWLKIGIVSFLLYYMYDINMIFLKVKMGNILFPLASFLLVSAAAGLVYSSLDSFDKGATGIICLLMAVVMLALLIYTLFFALPVKEAYSGEVSDDLAKVCDRGMYALCRHPGVIWFTGLAFSLYLAFPAAVMGKGMTIFCVMNFLYIVLQDVVIFPRQFSDYGEYKEYTPFLIPNLRSIRRAVETGRKDSPN